MALVAHAGRVDGAIGGYCERSNLAARRLEEHVAFALWADAIDQARAVRAGDQVALRVPCERADVLLVALEEEFRLCSGLGGIDAIDRCWPAGSDVKPTCRVEGHLPDVVRLRFGFGFGFFWAFVRTCLFFGSFGGGCRWLVQFGGIKDELGGGFILLGCGVGLEPVNLAAGQRGRVDGAVRAETNHLDT